MFKKNITSLKHLSLDRVHLASSSSSWGQSISRLSELINITMTNSGLMGSIPPSLQKLFSLQILYLNHNTFNTELPSWIGNMTSFVSLQMSKTNLNWSISFERLSRLPYLNNIYLGNNKICGNVYNIFQGKWKKVTLFHMPNHSLHIFIPSFIGNLSYMD